MGIDLEHFDEPPAQEFLCVYCRKVFLYPIVTECGHVLCTKCFKKRSKKRLRCPVCGKPMGEGGKHALDPIWRRRYDKIKVNCTKGCEQLVTLRELDMHLSEYCPLTIALCTNPGCTKKIRRRDLPGHLSLCDYRTVECEGCGHRTKSVNLRMHQIVQKCMRRRNLHMVVQSRREMNARVKEYTKYLQAESFKRELDERDIEKTKMWAQIARNNPSRPVSVSPSAGRSRMQEGEEAVLSVSAPPSRQGQRRTTPHSRVSTPRRPHSPTDTARLCLHCNKLFIEQANHEEACCWHKGPIVDVFGGMCQSCGKLDNLEGCATGYHFPMHADYNTNKSSRKSPGSTTFLTST